MMKPRDSIASTASHFIRAASFARCSVTALNAIGFASTGVMSLNTMPAFGKSGTSTISDLISSGLIAGFEAPLPECARCIVANPFLTDDFLASLRQDRGARLELGRPDAAAARRRHSGARHGFIAP